MSLMDFADSISADDMTDWSNAVMGDAEGHTTEDGTDAEKKSQ